MDSSLRLEAKQPDTMAVSVRQKYTLPSQLNSSVSSLVFPGSDRLKDTWLSESSSSFIRHHPGVVKAAQEGGAGAASSPKGIAEFKSTGVMGHEPYDPSNTENKAAFPLYPSDTYRNPRAAKVVPPSGTGLYLGSEANDFLTDSRANFRVPGAGERGPNAAERRAINLAINVAKFTLGTEPAPGNGFETTSRAAAAHMLAAQPASSARPASGASKSKETAAQLAKVTHIDFSADRHPADPPSFLTTQLAGLPRHPTAAYAQRQGPCDPSASMGALAAQSTCLMVQAATGAVVSVPRVQSGLDMGRDAPVWQTSSMAATGQAVKQNPGGVQPAFLPKAQPLKLVRFHPAITAAASAARE